jgi:hypothetical protein
MIAVTFQYILQQANKRSVFYFKFMIHFIDARAIMYKPLFSQIYISIAKLEVELTLSPNISSGK